MRTTAERTRRARAAQAFVADDTGRALGAAARARMEAAFGTDLARVRVHDGERAAETARGVGAAAFAFGDHVVVPAGERAEHLLAHELAHVVQQRRPDRAGHAERGARDAAARVTAGGAVDPRALGGTAPGFHAQEGEEEPEPRAPARTERSFTLHWDEALYTPLSRLRRPTLSPRSLFEPLTFDPTLVRPSFLTPPTTAGSQDPAPSLPSRLSLLSSGRFSLGARLNFPEAEDIAGAPASALKESLARAEVLDQHLSGRIPSGWEAIDKAQLAQAVWGIFSTHIAPDVARNLTRGLSTTGPSGLQLQLDVVLLTDFSGGGLTFTLQH